MPRVGMAALTFVGVLSATDLAALGEVAGGIGPLGTLGALAVGAGTLGGAAARRSVVGPLREADEDDDLGLQGLLTWAEDLWGAVEDARPYRVRAIRGGRSPYLPDADIRRLVAGGCSVQTLAGAGHLLHVERPRELADQLLATPPR